MVTSKFRASEGWHEAGSMLRTRKTLCANVQNLVCAPLSWGSNFWIGSFVNGTWEVWGCDMELVYLWKHSSDTDMSVHVSSLPVIFRIQFFSVCNKLDITCCVCGGGAQYQSFTLQLHKRNVVVVTDGVILLVRAYFHKIVTMVYKKTVKRHWIQYRCTCLVCKNSLDTRLYKTCAAFYSGLHLLSRLVAFRPLACSRQPCWFARACIWWGNRWTFWECAWGKGFGAPLIIPSLSLPPLCRWLFEWNEYGFRGKGPPKATDFSCHSVRRCRHENNCLQLE
jgi:hypothetical protein